MPNIVLKNRDGTPVEYPTDRVQLMMSDGNQKEFVNAGSVPVLVPANIELDFSSGDMEIVPENGKAFSGVTVIRPETLVPENIAKDVDIGGVMGTHKGGDHFITYMSEDGTETLFVKPIMHGDTCGDVIALGFIDKPTKEATETEDYTFCGWTDSVGGAVDNTVFDTVTEDRTVYAVFEPVLASGTFASGAKWKLGADGVFTVFGEGAMDDYASKTKQPWYNHIGDIQSLVIEDGITHIGNYAFYNCTGLTSVVIPDGVTSIGKGAFGGCTGLTSIDIPDSVTTIGGAYEAGAFYKCTGLTSIVIPDGVTSIGGYAFQDCTKLASVTIGSGVTSIGLYAFWRCSALTSIVIPDSVTTIGQSMFDGCTALANVTLGSGLGSIGISMFSVCTSLTSIIIPDGVVSIGATAFKDCSKLASVTIGSGVTSIDRNAFTNCTKLTSVTFKDTTTWYVGTSAGATTTQVSVTNTSTAATYLKTTYASNYWTKL